MVGVRDITLISEYSGDSEDESHAWSAISFDEMRHGFAENILCQQFGYACVGVLRHGELLLHALHTLLNLSGRSQLLTLAATLF